MPGALPRMPPASQETAKSSPVLRRWRRMISSTLRATFSASRSIIWPPTMPQQPEAWARALMRSQRTAASEWILGLERIWKA